jgi:hypothetical protein
MHTPAVLEVDALSEVLASRKHVIDRRPDGTLIPVKPGHD